MIVSCSCTVRLFITPVLSTVVNKTSPNDGSAIWFQHFRKHIGSIRMRTSISKWTGTAFGICLYQKSSKIWNHLINMCHGFSPPGNYLRVKWIRNRNITKFHRSRKIDTHKQTNSISGKQIGILFYLFQIHICDKVCFLFMNIYIIDDNGIDSNGCHQSRIHLCAVVIKNFVIIIKK